MGFRNATQVKMNGSDCVTVLGARWLSPASDPKILASGAEARHHPIGRQQCRSRRCKMERFRLLKETLALLALVERASDSSLQPNRHLQAGVIRPVSIFHYAHEPAHQKDHLWIPPPSSQRPIISDILELSALLGALALPRGIEPLFQP
jgi:hypothetical protein